MCTVTPTFFGAALGTVSSGGLAAAGQQLADQGASLEGIAAIIAASAGMISAIGALVIGWRSKQPTRAEIEEELKDRELLERIARKLEEEDP